MNEFSCCGNCRWAHEYEEVYEWLNVTHECRRYPPQVYGCKDGSWATFPGVRREEWCGEWEKVVE